MSATTVAAPAPAGHPKLHAWRIAAVALAVIVLLAVAFILGRVTASRASTPSPATPAASAPGPARPASIATPTRGAGEYCPFHQPC